MPYVRLLIVVMEDFQFLYLRVLMDDRKLVLIELLLNQQELFLDQLLFFVLPPTNIVLGTSIIVPAPVDEFCICWMSSCEIFEVFIFSVSFPSLLSNPSSINFL